MSSILLSKKYDIFLQRTRHRGNGIHSAIRSITKYQREYIFQRHHMRNRIETWKIM